MTMTEAVMTVPGVAYRVVVVGPADLATTALVTALEARRIPVEQADVAPFAVDGPEPVAVGVVDVSRRSTAMREVADVLAAGMRLVVLSDDPQSPRVAAAVAAGAAGWVSTTEPLSALVTAVCDAAAGRALLTPGERSAHLARHSRDVEEALARTKLLDRLTDREFAVLRHLERGMRAADIAIASVVSITTVRTQIRSILHKLEVNSQEAAVGVYRDAVKSRLDR